MTEPFKFKIEVPKGSRLDKYLDELPNAAKGKGNEFSSFLKRIFLECLEFVKQNLNVKQPQTYMLQFVLTHQQFREIYDRETERATSLEMEKFPELLTAFVFHSKNEARIYLDLEAYLDLLKHGDSTFTIHLVRTYIEETIHMLSPPQFSEQQTHDLECELSEKFLGIKLPDEVKNLKDYYFQDTKPTQSN